MAKRPMSLSQSGGCKHRRADIGAGAGDCVGQRHTLSQTSRDRACKCAPGAMGMARLDAPIGPAVNTLSRYKLVDHFIAFQVPALRQHRSAQFIAKRPRRVERRSEEHTSELQSLMRHSYAVSCLTKKIHL